jgi:predicted nucleic acid-binding protein
VPTVSNSSPLIALAAIERLNLLPALFESVLIPPAVSREIHRSIPAPPAWLRTQILGAALPEIVQRRTLGDGEREAIALAVELNADRIILDDLPGRRVAQAAGLSVIGTVGVLLGAKRSGLVERIRPELDNLLRNSFFLSQELYDELIDAAGEMP